MTIPTAIADYIQHHRNLGKRFASEARILAAFNRSVGKVPLHCIRPVMITRFTHREGAGPATIAKKHRVLAGFFRYAVTRGRLSTSPMPRLVCKRNVRPFVPYIYSRAELKRLIAAAPAATGTHTDIDAETLRTILILLYGAGLRRSEALRLTMSDVDLHRALLHIRGTKFYKTRMVPIGAELCAVLTAFIGRRLGGRAPQDGDRLFLKTDGTPASGSAVAAAFRRLRAIAGIERDGPARNQPRMHDLRHSAAVHRVTAWYRSGADLNDLLPKLATWLGHKDLSGTQRYLTMTEELLAEAGRRFETFAMGGRDA
jgi:integrase